MSDSPPKTRKTLTIKKGETAPAAESAERRQRSGARARQVAQMEIVREKKYPARSSPRDSAAPRKEAPSALGRPDAPARKRAPAARPQPAPSGRPGPRDARPRPKPRPAPEPGPAAAHVAAADPMPAFIPALDTAAMSAATRISRRPRHAAPAQIFPVFAPCPHGLEEALAAELQALGLDTVMAARAGCSFEADWNGIQRANLYSRLATRVLVQVGQGPVHHEDDIYELALGTAWEHWFGPEQTLRVDTSAIRSPMKSLQFCNLRAKDGICDRLREREGARPDIDTVRPDARVHLFLTEDSGTLYLDTSGESLFKRGWRLDKGQAPLRENLAAGLLALSDWDPARPLVDPFCGSGTILIEAAWIALGVPPGIWRPFGFERLRNHDARRWRDIKEEARSHIAARLDTPLIGYDIDPAAIQAARANLERAWLTPETIRFETGDARHVAPPPEPGWLVTNPPYGERMSSEDIDLWPAWAENLKKHYAGWQISVISSDLDLPRQLRLKPLRRYPLHNGALDCRLFSFEMVQASYRR